MSCVITDNIDCPSCGNVGAKGGLLKEIYLFNWEELETGNEVTFAEDGSVSAINLDVYKVGYKWCGVRATNGAKSFNTYNQEFQPETLSYNQTVLGRFRADSQATLNLLDETKGGSFLIVVVTNNQKIRVFGVDGGLDLSALTEASGQVFTDDNSANLTFSGVADELAPFFLDTDYATSIALLESYLT